MSPKIMVMERKMPRGAALWLAVAFCQLLCIEGQAQTANDPNVTVSPNGTNNIVYNAITESISFPAGYSQVQYSVNGGPWTSYTGPFTIDGNDPRYPFTPGGSAHGATLQVCFNNGTTVSTNTYTPALFEIAPLVGNPPMNPAISGYRRSLLVHQHSRACHGDHEHRHGRSHYRVCPGRHQPGAMGSRPI